MILVDSSVWVDFFKGRHTPQTAFLNERLGTTMFVIGDLILTEVLQGFIKDAEFNEAALVLYSFPTVELGGYEAAIESAAYFRTLRRKGVTVRGTIDVVIATYCLRNNYSLLYADRDFDHMVKHIGLKSALLAH